MRPDEEFVKAAIQSYLEEDEKENFINIVEGEDPPDYYVNLSEKKVLLEVTNAEEVFPEEDKLIERNTIDRSLGRFGIYLNEKYGHSIPNNKSILIYFQGPFDNFNKFKIQVEKIISEVCINKLEIDEEYSMFSGKVTIKTVTYTSNKVIGIVGVRFNKDVVDIQKQVEIILSNIIIKKELKTSMWQGEKWLGILNNCVLANNSTFARAIKHINHGSIFRKIIVVDKEGNKVDILK